MAKTEWKFKEELRKTNIKIKLFMKKMRKLRKNIILYGTERKNYRACWPLTEENLI